MYLKRKINDYLIECKNDINHKPLIIKGARQIGKTESIMHFAKNNYENVIYINFVFDKKYMNILEDGYDTATVIKNISLINPSFSFIEGKTIIIFDEIQENPDITTLKAFYLDGKFDVICSGSMLGINYKKIHSNSVGYKSDYELYYPDTGLLVSSLDDEAQDDLRVNKNLGVYKGALYENFVTEAFVKQGL